MNNNLIKTHSHLKSYMTASLGLGCFALQADAAITITDINSPTATFNGLDFSFSNSSGSYDVTFATTASNTSVGKEGTVAPYDLLSASRNNSILGAYTGATYFSGGSFQRGASLGDQNFLLTFAAGGSSGGLANLDTVVQFDFDGAGGGIVVAIAHEAGGIDFADAVVALNVPEPSSLTLLALGAGGLITRRQRNKTA